MRYSQARMGALRRTVCLVTLIAAGILTSGAAAANAAVVATTSAGTGPPPTTLGGFSLTPFAADPSAVGTQESSIAAPNGGTLGFSPSVTHEQIGDGWASWSNGYTGDVYFAQGQSSDTLTLSNPASAFYLYAEPDNFAVESMTATSDSGATATVDVNGSSGAQFFGFYGTGGDKIVSVTVSNATGDDFATGEFGVSTTGNAVSSTVVSCSPVSVRVGGSSTCTATVTSHASHPSGTVSFASDGAGSFDSSSCTLVLIGGNQSRCSVHFTPSAPGSQMITGSYSGDSSSAPSSGSASLSVGKASSSTSVSCSPSSAVVGGASTSCTATVTGQAPSGSVAFASNSSGTFTPASSCTLVAVDATHASCSVTYSPRSYGTGTHKIYGTYSGDSNNSTSTGSTTISVT